MPHPPVSQAQTYASRGVSADKSDLHQALEAVRPKDKHAHSPYPKAFCQILPDVFSGDPNWCFAMHADGVGSKSIAAVLAYCESGDPSVFSHLAHDAVVMNTDDLLCIGASGPFVLSNTIARNARHIPAEALKALLAGYQQVCDQFADWGVDILLSGGETADLGDIARTLVVDATLATRLKRSEVIDNAGVKPGDIIIGLSSDGQASYEKAYNSGIGSNGLTSARHDLLDKRYVTMPDGVGQSYDPHTDPALVYRGQWALQDSLPNTPLTIGQALLSPTRTYFPLLHLFLQAHRQQVSALIHCTGGGQTKCLQAGTGIHYIKDNLFAVPALFQLIRQAHGTAWRELYQVFNMGHRMEVIGSPSLLAPLQDLGRQFLIDVQQVGYCEAVAADKINRQNHHQNSNQVSIHTPDGVEVF